MGTRYGWWGGRIAYWSRHRLWVQCLNCGADLAVGLLTAHCQTKHGIGLGAKCENLPSFPKGEPQTYHISFLVTVRMQGWPVKECPVRAAMRMGIHVHLLHRNVQDTVIILEEGNLHHPRFPCCKILVPWAALKVRHPNTAQCSKGVDQKRHRMAAQEMQAST